MQTPRLPGAGNTFAVVTEFAVRRPGALAEFLLGTKQHHCYIGFESLSRVQTHGSLLDVGPVKETLQQ
eukprot:4961631-Pyramimonas_sp.AAC.4